MANSKKEHRLITRAPLTVLLKLLCNAKCVLRCLLLTFCILPNSAHAYSSELIRLLEKNDYKAAYQWLSKNEAAYAYDPAFNEWLAQMAITQLEYAHAINALERLVLLQPEHMGAQLDLVIAYSKAGYLTQARQQLESFQRRLIGVENIPAKVSTMLLRLSEELAETTAPYKLKGLFQIGGGFDSNANLGASDSTVTLNIQGQFPVEQELGEESIESNDLFHFERVQLAIEESPGQCYLVNWCASLIADVSNRSYTDLTVYNKSQFLLGGFLNQRQTDKSSQWLGYVQYANLNDFDQRTSFSVEFNQRYRLERRWLGYALHFDYSHDAGSSLPDSQQYSLTLFTNENSNWRYNWSLAFHSQPERAAGNSYRSRLGINYRTTVSNWLVRSSINLTLDQDTEAYSQLLFGGEKRRDISAQASTSAMYKLSSNWAASLNASYTHNVSTIPLFNRDRFELFGTLSYIW